MKVPQSGRRHDRRVGGRGLQCHLDGGVLDHVRSPEVRRLLEQLAGCGQRVYGSGFNVVNEPPDVTESNTCWVF